jgi:hypothetical protein
VTRKIISISAFATLVAATIAITAFLIDGIGPAWAQGNTCSGLYQQCVPLARNPKLCLNAKASCMKTGRWIGPETGRDYGPAEKR